MGNRTTATYILYTDGGGIPAFLANIVNKQCIAKVFVALRARVSVKNERSFEARATGGDVLSFVSRFSHALFGVGCSGNYGLTCADWVLL